MPIANSAPATMPLRRIIAIGLSFVAVFALGALMSFAFTLALVDRVPAQAEAPEQQGIIAVPQATELPVAEVPATLDGARESMRLGNPTAAVQIVVFSDPQCPFCRKSAIETEPQIIEQYVKTGKATLVYRHFTFLGPESQRIAEAMECAAEQRRFWEFHRLVFERQFPENAGLATDEAMLDWATEAGLDKKLFADCMQRPETAERVQADTNAGRRLGVTGTPTLFINGRPMPGALPYDFLKTAIEAQLATPDER